MLVPAIPKPKECGSETSRKDESTGNNNPKCYAGTVIIKDDSGEEDDFLQQWKVWVKSEAFEEPVEAWADEPMGADTKVQFCLEDSINGGTQGWFAWFETTKGAKNPDDLIDGAKSSLVVDN